MYYGKLVAGLLGLLLGGLFGLVIGLFLGHFFDRGFAGVTQAVSPEQVGRIKRSFFECSFQLQGFLAKADGRISEAEIAHTEAFIRQMALSADQRKEAIDFFQRGATPDFNPEILISAFLTVSGLQRQLHQMLLLFLISLALADGQLDQAEYQALLRIARALGFSQQQLDQLLRMAQAQASFHAGAGADGADTSVTSRLKDAYTALGINADTSDKELKQAYRRLMSEHHPDKLIAQGVPEHMVKVTTEKSQEIQAAYELIRNQRGIRR